MLEQLFGGCSSFYRENGEILDMPPVTQYLNGRCYNAMLLTGASPKPERVFEQVKKVIEAPNF